VIVSAENLSQSVRTLFARTTDGIKPGLETITELLAQLGSPHEHLKVIHVAGTNGKGSVCAVMESVLRASGFKTGLYTSPHLHRFNERFRVNGREISDHELNDRIADVLAADAKLIGRSATFFELSTAIAFEHFRQEGVDYAVIETGMGGRWDATNIVTPVLSVITRIDVDHTGFLSDDLEKIAWEKAGIIKAGLPVLCGLMPAEAEKIIYREAKEKGSLILGSEEAIFVSLLGTGPEWQELDIETGVKTFPNVKFPLVGPFQRENAATAVAALDDLADLEGLKLDFKKGLEAVRWPGRFELLQKKPPVIFDGAHNPGAARALFETLTEIFPGKNKERGFVFGFLKDKDVEGILRELAPLVSKGWAVPLDTPRALSAEEIAGIGERLGLDITPLKTEEVRSVCDAWLGESKKRLVCLAGSLYFAEEVKHYGFGSGQ